MSTSLPAPEREPSEDPNLPPGTYSSAPRRPIYRTETTGNYWVDVREAFKVRHATHPPRFPFHIADLLFSGRYDLRDGITNRDCRLMMTCSALAKFRARETAC